MKRQTLETAIREYLSKYPAETRFRVKAFELQYDGCGLSVNDAWYLSRDADKARVIEIARGRWEIFKVNYAPKARVKDLEDTGYSAETGISLECDHLAFLDIEPLSE